MRFPNFILLLIFHELLLVVTAEDSFVVGGYLPDYRFYINVNDTASKLTDLIIFSLQPSKDGIDFPCCLDFHHYDIARKSVAHKISQNEENLNIWVTIGGGGRSTEFIQATESSAFIHSITELAATNSIQGIDLDCEHFTSQTDFRKYIHWLEHAVPKLQQHGLKVSIAIHAGMYMPSTIYEKVDRIHLMTYDMMYDSKSMTNQPKDHYHADMYQTNQAVQRLVHSGCPKSKIVLGIPAYARHYQNPGMVKTYAEIVDEATLENLDQRSLSNDWKGYRGESLESVATKIKYARQQNLGGVFIWELGQDKQVDGNGGFLLDAISKASKVRLTDKEEL